jgi:outer membrane lipoprotein SlyB
MTKILVAFLMALALFGCNNNSSNDVPASGSEQTQEPSPATSEEDASADQAPADQSASE